MSTKIETITTGSVLDKSHMKLHIQKRSKALNPAFKRFQSLPPVPASKPPGQFAIPAVVLTNDPRGNSSGRTVPGLVVPMVQRLANPCCVLAGSP